MMTVVAAPEIFFKVVIKKFNYKKFNKNRTLYIDQKTHIHTQIHKILQFPFTNFLILKSLHESLIINTANYIPLKILVR